MNTNTKKNVVAIVLKYTAFWSSKLRTKYGSFGQNAHIHDNTFVQHTPINTRI